MNKMFKIVAVAGTLAATLGLTLSSIAVGRKPPTSIEHYVLRPGDGYYYQVIQGSGTGGGWVYSPRWLSDGTYANGYTDRAERGYQIKIDNRGSGTTVTGYGWNGADQDTSAPVGLPVVRNRTVPTNPSADNYYSFVGTGGNRIQLRLPIGVNQKP